LFRHKSGNASLEPGVRVDVADELADVIAGRARDDFPGCAGLNDAAALEYGDAVTESERLIKVVAHEHDGFAHALLQREQLVL